MTSRSRGFGLIWPQGEPLIGMIHLPPLPGSPRWSGSMAEVVDRAGADARTLAEAGYDGVLVENFGDVPFFADTVPAETVAALTRAVVEVRHVVGTVPVGVNVLRNDALAALGVAAATGARFVRVNVLVGSMWTDQGLVHGRAAEVMRRRATIASDVAVLADVHVKHAVPVAGATLSSAATDSWHRGLADALIASGTGTGRETSTSDVSALKAASPDAAVLVGSGLSPANAAELLRAADGAIVGSSIMRDARAGGPVDPDRARALRDAARA